MCSQSPIPFLSLISGALGLVLGSPLHSLKTAPTRNQPSSCPSPEAFLGTVYKKEGSLGAGQTPEG